MPEFETIIYEKQDGIATVTLNRPERLNGMTNTMVAETHIALERAARDRELKVLILTGAGRGFCPGADLKHFTDKAPREDTPLSPENFSIPVLLHEMPAVTIAAINGACAGAGLGWACGCDLRFAAESATFNTAFLAVAVAGDMGLPWTLPRLVGAAKARELSFLPGKFRASEAERMGLVSKVFPDNAFREEIDKIASQLARSAPLAIRNMKSNYVAAEHMSFGDFISLETERHMRITASADTQEAFKAFVEKREPRFQGR